MLKKTLVTEKGEVSVHQVNNNFILEATSEQIIALCQQFGTFSITQPSDLRQLGEIKPQASSSDKPNLVFEETNIEGRLEVKVTDKQFILRLRDQCAVKVESPSQPPDLTVIKKRLQARYEQNSQIKRLFYPQAPLALKDCYLQLALLQDEKRPEEKPPTSTEKSPERDYALREYERLQTCQQKLEVTKILDKCPAKTPKRIYIEGAAGAGKSTLCQYIADQWAMGQAPWSGYEWVFLIRLRELTKEQFSTCEPLDEVKLIEKRCFQTGFGNTFNAAQRKALLALLEQSPRQFLFILDGLDELNGDAQVQALWENLVQSDYDLLVTARPGVSHSVKEALGTTLSLGVLGFSDEQVATYVKHFFTEKTPELSSDNAAPCLSFLRDNPNVWSLSHTPIQLELICSIWGKDLQALQPVSLTGLYELMLDKILAREFHKQQPQVPVGLLMGLEQEERYQSALPYLERLAFLGMQAKQIVLLAPLMHQAHAKAVQKNLHEKNRLWQLLEATGLVKRHNEGAQAEFAHLTFQEYFAARYLVHSIMACWGQPKLAPLEEGLDSQALQEFIADTKLDSFYTVMWGFVAGLLARAYPNQPQPPVFQRLVDSFLASRRTELDLEELSLLLRCLEEAPGIVIAQHSQLMANLQRWAEFYLTCDYHLEGTLLVKLWQTLRACPGVIRQLAQAKPALVRWLGEQLQHKNDKLKYRAVDTLGTWGRFLPAVAEILLPLLAHPNQQVRAEAAYAVGAIGAQANAELQRGLVSLLADEKWQVRMAAAYAVGQLGAQASVELQRGLVPLLSDKEKDVRKATAWAVRQLGAQASVELQRGLLTLLADKDEWVRQDAAYAVGAMGVKASAELQKGLAALLGDENKGVRWVAAQAVRAMWAQASAELQQGLVLLLADEKWQVRRAAAYAVGSLGAQASPELQQGLAALLADEKWQVRREAADAVGQLGAQASAELQRGLVPLLSDKEKDVRRAAANAVRTIGAQASPELQSGLLILLANEEWLVRQVASHAAEELGARTSPEIQAVLITLSTHQKEAVRHNAMQVLAKFPQTFTYFCHQLLAEGFPVPLRASFVDNLLPQYAYATLVRPVSTQLLAPQPAFLMKPDVSNLMESPRAVDEGPMLGGSPSVKQGLVNLSTSSSTPLLPVQPQIPSLGFLPQYASLAAKNPPPAAEGVKLSRPAAEMFRVTISYPGLGLSLEQAKLLQPHLTSTEGLGSFGYIKGSAQSKKDCIIQLDFDDELAAQALVQTIKHEAAQLRQGRWLSSLPTPSGGG